MSRLKSVLKVFHVFKIPLRFCKFSMQLYTWNLSHLFLKIKHYLKSFEKEPAKIHFCELFCNWTSSFLEKKFQSFLYFHTVKTGHILCCHVFPGPRCRIRNISVKLFWNCASSVQGFQNFPYSHQVKTGHVFQGTKMAWGNLIKDHRKIISVKLFWNWPRCL